MSVAQTILEQLGGHRFTAMTGARQFVGDEVGRSLHFSIPGRRKVRITLGVDDRYTVEVFIMRGIDCKPIPGVHAMEGVYADRLQAVFTELTGLDTHL